MNWLDILILIILVINIAFGLFRGLIKSVVNIISIILGFAFAKIYYLDVYKFLNERYDLLSKIKLSVSNAFSNINFPEISDVATMSSDELVNSISNSNYLEIISKKFFESDYFINSLSNNIAENFSLWLSNNILSIFCMVIIFIVIYFGVRILGSLLDKVFKIPILNGVNRLSGLIFGIIKGCFFSMLIVLIIVVIGPIFDKFNIINVLETSRIAIYFYKYNVITFIFEMLI